MGRSYAPNPITAISNGITARPINQGTAKWLPVESRSELGLVDSMGGAALRLTPLLNPPSLLPRVARLSVLAGDMQPTESHPLPALTGIVGHTGAMANGRKPTDNETLAHIRDLVAAEKDAAGRSCSTATSPQSEEHDRLRRIEVELDQCWDLLRQRRALRETGGDPREAGGAAGRRGRGLHRLVCPAYRWTDAAISM